MSNCIMGLFMELNLFFLGCTGKWVKIRPSRKSDYAIRHNGIAASTANSQWPSERIKNLVIVNPLILALIFRFGVTFQWPRILTL